MVKAPVKADALLANTSGNTLYGTLLRTSRSARSKAESNGLKLDVNYATEDGKALNPSAISQGTRFKAIITVTNSSPARPYESMALSFGIPSGWEIINDRLAGTATEEDGYDHLDIRDARADWFFGLPEGRSKTFTLNLRAAYCGSFVMPSTVCQAMYEPAVNAFTADGTAEVK